MGLFDFLKSKKKNTGIPEDLFNSTQYEKEILALAHMFYFQNEQNYAIVNKNLQKEGLSELQSEIVVDKLKIFNKKSVADFDEALNSGAISEIKITPNPEHVKGKVNKEQVDKYIGYGAFQMERGDYDNALELFNKAIELDENAALAYANKGTLYSELNDFDNSLKNFDIAIALKPNTKKLYTNKALVLDETGNKKEATICYRKAIEIDPDDFQALNNLGINLIEEGNFIEAKQCFEKIILKTDDDDAKINFLNTLVCMNEYEAAYKFYETTIKKNPGYTHLHFTIPNHLFSIGNRVEAYQFFDDYLVKTNNYDYLKYKGNFQFSRDKVSALESYDAYLQKKPGDTEVLTYKLNLLLETEPFDEELFINSVNECLEYDNDNFNALCYKAQYLLKTNERDKALELAFRLFKINHREQISIQILLDVLNKYETKEGVLNLISTFANQLTIEGRYQLGYVKGLYLKGNNFFDEALIVFNNLNIEHKFAWNYYQMAIIYNLINNTSLCLENLKKTFESDPSLKEDARTYSELINLQTNAEFQNLLN